MKLEPFNYSHIRRTLSHRSFPSENVVSSSTKVVESHNCVRVLCSLAFGFSSGASMLWVKMASNASSDVEPKDEKTDKLPNKTGQAAEYPEFAIIWSFLENFRDLLHFPVISLETRTYM